ncbi:uncharacterized protein PAC_08030 [Phialocephala subalpina]|uniref:Heterokaryon incompatibility domain-containing protein n=1 Tax=Phialocephala subalpina TaxID=576137 RepID=A0A1L7WZE4_9HELO|nr:uncharacterized protein PAC_08030 [Phialocephala subalpina]
MEDKIQRRKARSTSRYRPTKGPEAKAEDRKERIRNEEGKSPVRVVSEQALRADEEQYNVSSLLPKCQDYFELEERRPSNCCKYCQNALDQFNPSEVGKDRWPQDFEHYDGQSDLKASAEGVCGICAQVQSQENCHVNNAFREKYRCLAVELAPAVRRTKYYDASASSDMSSRVALPLAKMWLQRCARFDCCMTNGHRELPTRLLFLGDNRVRLCLSKELDGCPEYASLSHCWGSFQFETLKRENVATFREHVPPTVLTKSFRDAIYTTRYLGFQYLWIDSLCIIQDYPNDWNIEASRMSSVYGNSSINIAASGGIDGSAGLFIARDAN